MLKQARGAAPLVDHSVLTPVSRVSFGEKLFQTIMFVCHHKLEHRQLRTTAKQLFGMLVHELLERGNGF